MMTDPAAASRVEEMARMCQWCSVPIILGKGRYCGKSCATTAVRHQTRIAPDVRFWSKVNRDTTAAGCWIWTACNRSDGYGDFTLDGKQINAHRYALELALGRSIPDGWKACHACDVRNCVRNDGPEGIYTVAGVEYRRFGHLWLGTTMANNTDMAEKGRDSTGDRNGSRLHPDRMRRGERVNLAKLTEVSVIEIKRRAAAGESPSPLAREYGVGRNAIWRITSGRTWGHVRF